MDKRDLLTALGSVLPVILRGAPGWIEDAKRLAQALRTHPDPAVRPGADHIEAAVKAAETLNAP